MLETADFCLGGNRMARMHSRKRGKSGSTRPVSKAVPSWVRYKAKEVELLVVKLAKEGNTASQIGIRLRDTYGIPDVKAITKKTITKTLAEKKLLGELPEDLLAVIRKNVLIRKHIENNKQDMVAKRGLQLADSKIKRLVDYYKDNGRLAKDWKYDPAKLRLLIE
jgi:small subunit ribosomal protein S15